MGNVELKKKVLKKRRIFFPGGNNKPLLVRFRAYHPTYMVCYFGNQNIAKKEHNKTGFEYVYQILKKDTDTFIELVKEYDDICLRCKKLESDEKGSVWGKDKSCTSSRNEEIIRSVTTSSLRVLEILELDYGAKVSWKELVKLLFQRIPRLDDPMIGGLGNQDNYENGFRVLGIRDK